MSFEIGKGVFTPYAQVFYVHEFEDDRSEVFARFAGDNRGDDATFFSFKTDTPDRDYFELSGGLVMQFDKNVQAVIGAQTLLDHDLYDSTTVHSTFKKLLQIGGSSYMPPIIVPLSKPLRHLDHSV